MSITGDHHYKKLEWMYRNAAPINQIYKSDMKIGKGTCELRFESNQKFFHAANALHGSVYFKLLDDAAFFASNSLVNDVMLVTASFNIYFVRPVLFGSLLARAEVVSASKTSILAEAVLKNTTTGKEVARGSGVFAKSSVALNEDIGYK